MIVSRGREGEVVICWVGGRAPRGLHTWSDGAGRDWQAGDRSYE